MSAERKNENITFILPEDLERLRKNKNTLDIEKAIRNIEILQRMEVVKDIDNTEDFIRIEAESMEKAIQEPNLDIAMRLLPTFLSDVKKFFRGKR